MTKYGVVINGDYSIIVDAIDEHEALNKAYDKYKNKDIGKLLENNSFIGITDVKINKIEE